MMTFEVQEDAGLPSSQLTKTDKEEILHSVTVSGEACTVLPQATGHLLPRLLVATLNQL